MIDRAFLAGGLSAAVLLTAALRVHGSFAWLVAAPFFLLRRDHGPGGALLLGATFGIAAGLAAYAGWLAETAQVYFAAPAALAWVGAISLVIPIGALQGAVLALVLRLTLRAHGSAGLLAAGAAWSIWDWATLQIFPYYPWASLAAAQVDLPLALRSVAVLGQVGLTALTASGGLAVGAAFLDRGRRLRAVGLALATLSLVTAVGLWPRAAERPAVCSLESIDARLQTPPTSAEPHLEATRARALGWPRPPSAVLWPESSLPASPETDPVLRAELARLARDAAVVLIAGGPRTRWDADWQAHGLNSAFRLDADGRLELYDKRRLVPFAEYWPLSPLPVPSWLETDFVVAGREPGLFAAGGCDLGILLCFEAQRPELARELALLGAEALVVLSNDAHLPAAAARMELAQARLRAAETGLPVVRAANRGTSVWILGSGAVAARGDGFRAEIPAAMRAPAVTLAPLWLGLCLTAATLVSLTAGIRRRGKG